VVRVTERPALIDPLVGRTIGGRFRLISRLGAGGMSCVYLARHVVIDRLLAIKILRRELARNPVQRDRFLREARAANRINHDNIVEITDMGETEDRLVYLVMEYVPGESLLKAFANGPMPVARAFDIVRQCALALSRAHEMGIIHRDLKPENILLVQRRARADFVKLLDFGIAKILDAPSLTGSQQIFGTPGYIAPEYIQSTAIDGRADLYSLGVILYEAITGALPFDYEFPGDLLVKHVTEQPVAPSTRYPSIDAPVEQFLLRCLRKDPAQRFRDAFHFIDELDSVAERVGSPLSWGGMNEPRPGRARTDTDPEGISTGDRDQRDTWIGAPPIDNDAPTILEDVIVLDNVLTEPEESIDPARDGVLGFERWKRRYEVLHAALGELSEVPREVARALDHSHQVLAEMQRRADRVKQLQDEADRREMEGREIRASLGARIDSLAHRHSQIQGEAEKRASRKAELEAELGGRREGLDPKGEAALWELAALAARTSGDSHERGAILAELASLRTELETRSEEAENHVATALRSLSNELTALETLTAAIRSSLKLVEEHARDAEMSGLSSLLGDGFETPKGASHR
jgi:serine/threonine protein kinase